MTFLCSNVLCIHVPGRIELLVVLSMVNSSIARAREVSQGEEVQ